MTTPTPAASQEVAVSHPLQIAGLTATQHAIGTAYAYRLRGSTEEMLNRPVGDGAGGRGVPLRLPNVRFRPAGRGDVMKAYVDDRPGMMRIHIASERARLACERYTRGALRAHAKGRLKRAGYSLKSDLAWEMAQEGLIDAAGYLRDGFPEATS